MVRFPHSMSPLGVLKSCAASFAAWDIEPARCRTRGWEAASRIGQTLRTP